MAGTRNHNLQTSSLLTNVFANASYTYRGIKKKLKLLTAAINDFLIVGHTAALRKMQKNKLA